MTAELRNLPHIASMAFNEPLMLEPAYARVFFCALAGQLGISRLSSADLFTPENTGKSHNRHEARHCTSGHPDSFP